MPRIYVIFFIYLHQRLQDLPLLFMTKKSLIMYMFNFFLFPAPEGLQRNLVLKQSFFWRGGGCCIFSRCYFSWEIVINLLCNYGNHHLKEKNHIGSAVSEILSYRQTDTNPVNKYFYIKPF